MRWLRKEVRGRKIYLWILGSVILGYINTFIVIMVLHKFGRPFPTGISDGDINITSWNLPFLLVFFALFEEAMFRLPLMIAVDTDAGEGVALLFAAVLSVIFGVLHGGIINVFLQGAGGFMCCILFLKCGGYQKKYVQALAVSTTAHFLWNLSVCFIGIYYGAISM